MSASRASGLWILSIACVETSADAAEAQKGNVFTSVNKKSRDVPMANSRDTWQKPTQYCKTIILQLKTNKYFKN